MGDDSMFSSACWVHKSAHSSVSSLAGTSVKVSVKLQSNQSMISCPTTLQPYTELSPLTVSYAAHLCNFSFDHAATWSVCCKSGEGTMTVTPRCPSAGTPPPAPAAAASTSGTHRCRSPGQHAVRCRRQSSARRGVRAAAQTRARPCGSCRSADRTAARPRRRRRRPAARPTRRACHLRCCGGCRPGHMSSPPLPRPRRHRRQPRPRCRHCRARRRCRGRARPTAAQTPRRWPASAAAPPRAPRHPRHRLGAAHSRVPQRWRPRPARAATAQARCRPCQRC
mmetsp:Transcript_30232/g.89695  ORF Transcript_30232/g.89695 Transcript_30232/m.89695 type:complete len:281 (-) Transcript_30232:2303-3145(-)